MIMSRSGNPTILIVGAGIAGLTLAQALRRHGIASVVFERDLAANIRAQGWGLSIHSTLITMEAHLQPEIYDRVCDAQVNPEVGRDEVRGIPFINGATGKVEHEVPKSKRLRLRRDEVRVALLEGSDIRWGKKMISMERLGDTIRLEFEDGTTATGDVLVGADGNSSLVRKALAPTTHMVHKLPVNAVGVGLSMTEEQVFNFRDTMDPLYFFGTHPDTNVFVFWSLLEVPKIQGQPYRAQLYFSWMEGEKDEELSKMPALELFKHFGRPFCPQIRELVDSLPEDTEVVRVNLVDWPNVAWDNWGGKCTLIGDAAHCMVIYRGEGANHAIVDACELADCLKEAVDAGTSVEEAVNAYERNMRPRAVTAVETSRQAAIDAHSYSKINTEGSFALLGEKPV